MDILTCETGEMCVNCYIIHDGRDAAVIDPGEDAEKILGIIAGHELSVKYILLTHGHFDHIGAVSDIKEKTGAAVCIHKADDCMLKSAKDNFSLYMGDAITVDGADILLDGGEVLPLGDIGIKVLHTPGHTPGGVCYIADNALFSGDTLFYLSVGRSDFPSSDPSALDYSLRNVLGGLNNDCKVYPGHGPNTSLFFEKQNNPYMR